MSESLEGELRRIVRNSDGLFSIMLGTEIRDGVSEMKLTYDVGRAMDHYRSGGSVQIWVGGYNHKILDFHKNKLEINYFDKTAKSDVHHLSKQEMKRALTDIYLPAFGARKNRPVGV